ncbi:MULTISPECIES: J domain-containing protein [unclassified Nocardioides]|uniref:J domain-containing protein n=1 Tax=unclassified Nocardioides TaxID=2615069 RepID=UPI0006F69DB6|nr:MULTISPECIES: DnaJ domain-containing protein [unclassified Nocardioides]KRA30889.1 hypothetical protein ASD81_15405 [Nocardioides sp. Root614]KRA87509.1 hypothetical protein ASD84_15675 [Nocardioides sp. Root682]
MSVNNYDLLNVDESATADEIRAAWKAAIADLDPSDRRFRAYNDAAGVLLDEEKRASYDAGLVQARIEAEATQEPPAAADVTPVDVTPVDGTPVDAAAKPDTTAAAAQVDSGDAKTGSAPGPSVGTLVGVGIAAALSFLIAVGLFAVVSVRGDDLPSAVAERRTDQDKITLAVEGAAERMVAPVLSYNHKTMDEDLARLKGFLTTKMADKQSAAWPELTKEAQAQQIVVEATPTGTALTRVDPNGKRATVVVFINQYVEKKSTEPFVLHMWATMSLVREGGADGRWLLDDLCTDDTCG